MRKSKKTSSFIPLIALGGIGAFLLFSGEKNANAAPVPAGDPKAPFKDQHGVTWEFYQYKNGWLEASVIDASVPTEYVKTYGGPTRDIVVQMIQNHASAYAGALKAVK